MSFSGKVDPLVDPPPSGVDRSPAKHNLIQPNIQFKKPFGLEKSSPPNVVGLQSVYIIKSAPLPATQPPSLDQS